MSPIIEVDNAWTYRYYMHGNSPNWADFSDSNATISGEVATINKDENHLQHMSIRYERRYSFSPGLYEIEMDIDDGARVYAKNSEGTFVKLQAYNNGVPGESWKDQSRTTWTWKLDTRQLLYSKSANTIRLRVDGYNKHNQWVLVLKQVRLLEAYEPEAPPKPDEPPPTPDPTIRVVSPLVADIELSKSAAEITHRLNSNSEIESDSFVVYNKSTTTPVTIDVSVPMISSNGSTVVVATCNPFFQYGEGRE